MSWEEAARSEDEEYVWRASKIFSERAAWDFIEQETPHFSITSFCPPVIIGPPGQPYDHFDDLHEWTRDFWSFINGQAHTIPPAFWPACVDGRDLAKLQVLALSNPRARNRRYITISSPYTNGYAAAIVRNGIPEQARRVTPGPDDPPPHFNIDSSRVVRDFGIEWIPLERSVMDLATALYQKERDIYGRWGNTGNITTNPT